MPLSALRRVRWGVRATLSLGVAASVAATEPLLDLLDQHLATHRFIAGDHYTVADIPLACEMHRWSGLPLSLRPRPHLDAWVAAVRARTGKLK